MAIYIDITNMDLDLDAILGSEKYLTIIFLLFLLLANGLWICFSIARKKLRVLKEPRLAIRLSLVIGGIILALFTELMFAVLIFEQYSNSINCQSLYIARVFDQELLPMVYGIGLILLAIDIIWRSLSSSISSKNKDRRPLCVLIYALLPWFISLAVVTPLVLINVDLYGGQCIVQQSKDHQQVRIVVTTILQAGLAMIFAIFTFICSSNENEDRCSPEAFDDIGSIPTFDVKHISSIGNTSQSNYNLASKNVYVTAYDDTSEKDDYSFQNKSYATVRRYSWDQNESDMLNKERLVLLASCIVYLITVVPFNAISLYIMESYETKTGPLKFIYKPDTSVYIAFESMMWLRLTYPIILPFMWLAVAI